MPSIVKKLKKLTGFDTLELVTPIKTHYFKRWLIVNVFKK